MKRLMLVMVLAVVVAGLTVSCASLQGQKAQKCEKAAKKAEVKAEKMEKKAEAACEMKKVDSSLIDSVGYDPATQDLTIVFVKGGETYVYHKVPEKVYKKLMAAKSKGKFFSKNIKEKYEFTKK